MPQYNGIWTLQAQAQALTSQQWVTDPNFKNTTLLLQADNAANGAQNNTFLDSSSNAFSITRNGNTTQGSFTPFSQAPGYWSTYFGGSTDYIAFTSIAGYGLGTSNYTIECNINFNSASGNQRIFCIGVSGTDGLVLQYTGGTGLQLFSAASGSTTVFTYAFTPAVGIWYNFAVVRSGTGTNQVVLYVNGISVATGTSAVSVGQNAALIGGLSWNSTYTVNGYINNFRLSNTARYSANFNPATNPFSSDANTILLTCQSNRFVDNSSTGNTFTIGGTPSVQAFSPFAPQYQWTAPVIGGSGYFDGTGDTLTTASTTQFDFGAGNFTIAAWIYTTSFATEQGIVASQDGGSSSTLKGWIFNIGTTGAITFVDFNNGVAATQIASSAGVIKLNQWQFVVVERRGTGTNQFQIFVDGIAVATGTSSANIPSTTSNNPLTIGNWRYSTDTNREFTGYISNLKIDNSAIYNGTVTVPTSPFSSGGNTKILLNFTNAGIYDGKMSSNLETVGNAQVSTSVVKYGSGSMYFDGTGDYLQAPASNLYDFGSGDFTIECWTRGNNSASTAGALLVGVVTSGGATTTNWALFKDAPTQGYIIFYASDGTTYQVNGIGGAATLNDGNWHHVAVTRANSVFRVFVDGIQTGTTATWTGSISSTARPLKVGYNGSSEYLNGYIDDLRVTKGIARYIANFTPPQQALPRQ
jgi:hypothetical protein